MDRGSPHNLDLLDLAGGNQLGPDLRARKNLRMGAMRMTILWLALLITVDGLQ